MEECPICIDTTKTIISCTFCQEKCCKKCLQRVFNDQESVTCLYCKKEWTRKFIREKLGVTYLSKEYKRFNEKKGLDYEKSLLPATLLVVKERESIKKKQDEIDKVNNEIDYTRQILANQYRNIEKEFIKIEKEINIEKKYYCIRINQIKNTIDFGKQELEQRKNYKDKDNMKKTKMLKLILKIKKKEKISCEQKNKQNINYLKNEKNIKNDNLTNLERKFQRNIHKLINQKRWLLVELRNGGDVVIPDKDQIRNFIRACPDSDCRGYLSTQWKCGLCNKYTCSKCNIVKNDENHECNKDDVETALLLKNNTKPCPKCSTGIFKIDGCDQMWCTQCHTAFSWKSGQIQTRVHNPHYYEWLRENNSNNNVPPDGNVHVCGQALDNLTYSRVNSLTSSLHKIIEQYAESNKTNKEIIDILQQNSKNLEKLDKIFACYVLTTIHIQETLVQRFRTDDINNNLELRVKYLQNIIDEDTFRNRIQRSNKLHEKKKEIYDVLILVITGLTEIILRMNSILPFNFYKHFINNNGTFDIDTIRITIENQSSIYIGKDNDDFHNNKHDITNTINECLQISKEIPELLKYANTCLNDIAFSYNNSKYLFELDIEKICVYRPCCSLRRNRFIRTTYSFNPARVFKTEQNRNIEDYDNQT